MKYVSLFGLISAPAAYFVFCALVSAALAYPLHWVLSGVLDFQTQVFKCAEILMMAGLFPLGRRLGMGKSDIGLAIPKSLFLRQFARGFGYGALMLALHVLVVLLLQARVLDHDKLQVARIISLSLKGILIGLAVASIEEPVFRGFLLGSLVRKTSRVNAVLISAFYFAGLHFLTTDLRPEADEVRWDTGFVLVADAFHNLGTMRLDAFVALLAAGGFLACVRLLFPASGLGYCIGLHAGWVFIIKAAKPLTQFNFYSPWYYLVSLFDGTIGYLSAGWTTLLIVVLAVKIARHSKAAVAVGDEQSHTVLGPDTVWRRRLTEGAGAVLRTLRFGKPGLPMAVGYAVAAWTLIHLILARQTELIPEEAYYWTYSQHPALSYFDHPPMVAWLIGLGTAVFGNTELGVRGSAILLWPGTAGLLFLTGRLWFGRDIAALAVLLLCFSPIFAGVGFVVTPDAALLFFWSLTLYAISKALRSGQTGFWVLAGLGLGGAMLSKYTAVMLAGSLFVFLLLSAKYRHWLARVEPWLALLLAVAVFSPVIIWNAQHQWASFLFQSTRTAVVRHDPLHEASLFWLYQVLALTPFLLALYAYTLAPAIQRGWRWREDRWNFAMSFALPLFAVFVLASFKNKGHVNWTAPAYLSWSFAAAAVLLELDSAWQARRLRYWLLGLGIALSLTVSTIVHTSLAWGVPQTFALNNAGGWQSLAAVIGQARAELAQASGKPAFVVGWDKLNIAAEVGFYLHDPVDTVNDYVLGADGIGYRYWADLQRFEGRPAVVVLNKIEIYSMLLLQSYFAQVDEPVLVEVQGRGQQKRTAYLVKCYGYHFVSLSNLTGGK